MKTVKEERTFRATPHQLYEALMDSKQHAEFTGAAAEVSREVGGFFSAWDEYITGTNTELVLDAKIVQSWRASDWPEGHLSTVTFEFEPASDTETTVRFTHENIPDEFYEDIAQGWNDYYWEPLEEYFG